MGDAEGYLGGVEERAAFLFWNGANEDAIGDAGNKVPRALVPGEQGHGVAIGLCRVPGGIEFSPIASR